MLSISIDVILPNIFSFSPTLTGIVISILNSLEKDADFSKGFSDFDYSNYLSSLFEMPAGLFNIE
ncbi:MAG: hypothetical protein M1276_04350, partial [Deltaproteobacteria bacterium]|nr:hypothetical protein [Deltaproteobacteria bacterium]